jgi:beta-lactamase superfamily II metal-dependent hydrolase
MATAKKSVARTPSAKEVPTSQALAKTTAAQLLPAEVDTTRTIKVRMYNVGFGDAFLVRIPDGAKERRILFDCGSVESSVAGGSMGGIVNRIISDATDSDGVARIDVVVATHRHKDHVSGFADAAWSKVHVREVWLPWTEHPSDVEARRIREVQSRLAMGLNQALATAQPAIGAEAQRQFDVARDVVANALMLSNDAAMRTLHGGFAGTPVRRFFPEVNDPDDKPVRLVETPALPGVKVHVLGPSRDPDVIRDMDPPKGQGYLRLLGAAPRLNDGSEAKMRPFAPEFVVDGAAVPWQLSAHELQLINSAGVMTEMAVAVALDKAVNGTSLVLLLEVAGTLLLFPGDAQWGTWMNILDDAQWRELLRRVAFFKIGHHGSHNATPPNFVRKLMPRGCCAMASTMSRAIWKFIPKQELLTDLLTHGAEVARSDDPPAGGQLFRIDAGVVEAHVPF